MASDLSAILPSGVSSPALPIVFKSRTQPDIQLEVFSTIFHVHSTILKTHSKYFYTFLESADNSDNPKPEGQFDYNWVTKIDADGTGWQLIFGGLEEEEEQEQEFSGNSVYEVNGFTKLLNAIYNRPYALDGVDELLKMAELARLYGSLPALSTSLYSAFHRSPQFFSEMQDRACEVIEVAKELRHRELFNDALIFSLGPWTMPQCIDFKDPVLQKLAYYAVQEILSTIASTQHYLIGIMAEGADGAAEHERQFSNKETAKAISDRQLRVSAKSFDVHAHCVLYPSYYKLLSKPDKNASNRVNQQCKIATSSLLKNDLLLDKTKTAGEGACKNYFLCYSIDNEDLPWDTTQTDW